MATIASALALVLAAVSAMIIQRILLKGVAVHYVSLLIGIGLALWPLTNELVSGFNSEIFMGVIVAPLLFFEGQATRFYLVAKKFRLIVQLTVVMVLACLVVAGASVALISGLSLPLAFILAAISTPTDATASAAVANGRVIPERPKLALELESLFNDASGIILLNMAVLWYVRGSFSVATTLSDFFLSAGGGAVVGLGVGAVLVLIRQAFFHTATNNGDTAGTPAKIIYLLTPLAIYFLAEEIHVSGIIAVVCAGLIHNAEAERSRLTDPRLIHSSNALVELVAEMLNSIVFIILGVMLVRIGQDQHLLNRSWNWILVGLILYLANVVVRYAYFRLIFRHDRHTSLVFSLGGVHGTVTFALAYTVAETAVHHADFNLILTASLALIIISLLVPTIAFNFLLPRPESQAQQRATLQRLREAMVDRALERIQKIYLPGEVRESICFDLRAQKSDTNFRDFLTEWLRSLKQPEMAPEEQQLADLAYQLAFQEEREYLEQISQQEATSARLVRRLYKEVLMAEMVALND